MMQVITQPKVLVLLKATDGDNDFVCPNCQAYVARLKGTNVADLNDPETYALTGLIGNKEKDFLGVGVSHHGRLGDKYCRNKFYFWDIDQGLIRVTTMIKIARPYAAA